MIRCSGSLSILIYSFLFVLAAIKSYSLSLVETLTPNSFITAGCREKDWGSQKSNPGPRGDLPSVPTTNIKPHRVSTTQTVSFKRFIKKKIASLGLEPRAEGWSGWIEPVCRDLPRMRLETLQPDFPRWRYLSPGKVPLVPMLHSLLSLLRWVLLPESRSMSSIASMEAIGALPLRSNKLLL